MNYAETEQLAKEIAELKRGIPKELLPDYPSELPNNLKRHWYYFAKMLSDRGSLDPSMGPTITLLATSYELYLKYASQLEPNGTSKSDTMTPLKRYQIMHSLHMRTLHACGLTPAAGQRVGKYETQKQPDELWED